MKMAGSSNEFELDPGQLDFRYALSVSQSELGRLEAARTR